jgi:hypothetical protein
VSLNRFEFTGLCDIESDSGDVFLGLLMQENELSYSLKADLGDISAGDTKTSGSFVKSNAGATADLTVDSNFGNVRLNFLG